MNRLPNFISVFRILLSCLLPLTKNNTTLFFAAYILCGISDALDGYIARRYKWESKIGAKLDGLSDFIFYAIVLCLLLITTDIARQTWAVVGFLIVFVARMVNFIITKIKFSEWGMLHSWSNKAAGLLLFLCIPFALTSGTISFLLGVILFAAAIISAVEEMMILLSAKEYDANRKGYFM
ncbi:CDP-alcohol phosphatidyltransferase family protein [Ruminococcaceae bacterium OttesenSCG-928-I18]|nr:CDP-alcohol phosphatidyltransferase family protein [Ruminococcaceae bacterium OttesenSCG-928-I18]